MLNILRVEAQAVQISTVTSSLTSRLTVNTIVPQDSLFTHDAATHSSNTVVTSWFQDNNLPLNIGQTTDLIVDYRYQQEGYASIDNNGTAGERVRDAGSWEFASLKS